MPEGTPEQPGPDPNLFANERSAEELIRAHDVQRQYLQTIMESGLLLRQRLLANPGKEHLIIREVNAQLYREGLAHRRAKTVGYLRHVWQITPQRTLVPMWYGYAKQWSPIAPFEIPLDGPPDVRSTAPAAPAKAAAPAAPVSPPHTPAVAPAAAPVVRPAETAPAMRGMTHFLQTAPIDYASVAASIPRGSMQRRVLEDAQKLHTQLLAQSRDPMKTDGYLQSRFASLVSQWRALGMQVPQEAGMLLGAPPSAPLPGGPRRASAYWFETGTFQRSPHAMRHPLGRGARYGLYARWPGWPGPDIGLTPRRPPFGLRGQRYMPGPTPFFMRKPILPYLPMHMRHSYPRYGINAPLQILYPGGRLEPPPNPLTAGPGGTDSTPVGRFPGLPDIPGTPSIIAPISPVAETPHGASLRPDIAPASGLASMSQESLGQEIDKKNPKTIAAAARVLGIDPAFHAQLTLTAFKGTDVTTITVNDSAAGAIGKLAVYHGNKAPGKVVDMSNASHKAARATLKLPPKPPTP